MVIIGVVFGVAVAKEGGAVCLVLTIILCLESESVKKV